MVAFVWVCNDIHLLGHPNRLILRLAYQANEASLHHSSGTDACFLLYADTVNVWIGRSQFRHENTHSGVCGSSPVTGSWVLGRGIGAEVFQMFLVLREQQSQVLSGYIVFRRKQGAKQGDCWATEIINIYGRGVSTRWFIYLGGLHGSAGPRVSLCQWS